MAKGQQSGESHAVSKSAMNMSRLYYLLLSAAVLATTAAVQLSAASAAPEGDAACIRFTGKDKYA